MSSSLYKLYTYLSIQIRWKDAANMKKSFFFTNEMEANPPHHLPTPHKRGITSRKVWTFDTVPYFSIKYV